MEAIDAILTRRSVRRYTDRPVSDDSMTQLLRAAMAAPSARNQQPWQFIVVRERSLLEKMAEVSPYAKMVRHAQVAVVVCGDLENEESPGFWVVDCAACRTCSLRPALGLGAVCGRHLPSRRTGRAGARSFRAARAHHPLRNNRDRPPGRDPRGGRPFRSGGSTSTSGRRSPHENFAGCQNPCLSHPGVHRRRP